MRRSNVSGCDIDVVIAGLTGEIETPGSATASSIPGGARLEGDATLARFRTMRDPLCMRRSKLRPWVGTIGWDGTTRFGGNR